MLTGLVEHEVRHFHICCGAGGGGKGFNEGFARVGRAVTKFRCIGGVDNDKAAVRDFERLARAKGTVLDLFDREQYRAFHGGEPPDDWREATPEDLRRAAGYERPHIVFTSSPCKGFSGLLPEKSSKAPKYQALNRLALRSIWLALEAWGDDPPELFIFENVPRIAVRGRVLIDKIKLMLRSYGYAAVESEHDCGEIGNLAQSRKRFLLVARHMEKVPPLLYQPEKRPLRAVGEVLSELPFPLSGLGGPMHRVPSLQWKTWLRLAFVEAGSDWRSLNRLRVADGVLQDFALMPERGWQAGVLGVRHWDEPTGTVAGRNTPTNGAFSVADPRFEREMRGGAFGVRGWERPSGTVTGEGYPQNGTFAIADPRIEGHAKSVQLGVRTWGEPAPTVTGQMWPGQGPFTIADPRLGRVAFNHVYRIVPWGAPSPAIAGSGGPGGGLAVADPRMSQDSGWGGLGVNEWNEPTGTVIGVRAPGQGTFSVADPRTPWPPSAHQSKLAVQRWGSPSKTVTGSDRVGSGALSVADPRPVFSRDGRDAYLTAGHYGVVPWDSASGAVTGAGQHDNGRWSVADPRLDEGPHALPEASQNLIAVIRSMDGTWHRPFTTLELAALQGLVDPEEEFILDGKADSAWRERIGNAVPAPAAAAIASVMGHTLLLAWAGETFQLSHTPVWVRPLAIALSVDQAQGEAA